MLASENMSPLSPSSSVHINDSVLFQELQGEAVLFDLNTGMYFTLDKVGARIWRLLDEHKILSIVLEATLSEYDVTKDRCWRDLLEFVEKMKEQGLATIN
jgi:hypothetical protein